MEWLPFTARLEEYEEQAAALLRGHAARDARALRIFNESHPRFLDRAVKWLPLRMSGDDVANTALDIDDARLALARCYSFLDWASLSELVCACDRREGDVYEYEAAAEAVIAGDHSYLQDALRRRPGLAQARSSRRTCHDPAVHRATLLHYVSANGVESYRQRTPANAVMIAKTLLDAGSDPNALASMYGGECTTLSMLISSSPPADAGLQLPLIEVLLEYGADMNERGTGRWVGPVMTALVFGFQKAAELLASRGARIDNLAAAAGLGRLTDVEALLPAADREERHGALALAAQLGHVEVVRLLLDAGEDPNRFNPEAIHSHGTPLHHAASAGHEAVTRLLVERGARLDIKDKLWESTPLGWAEHGEQTVVADYLRSQNSR